MLKTRMDEAIPELSRSASTKSDLCAKVEQDDIPTVLVMMATFNGEQFIGEQIDSILVQEGVDVTLWVSDDGSTDGTCQEVLRHAASRENVRMTKNAKRLGVGRNFMQMVYDPESAGYDYYAFADQDDLWFPEKLSTGINAIIDANAKDEVALYYSEIVNCDACGKMATELSRFRPMESSRGSLLIKNWVNGCTMLFTEPLRNLLAECDPGAFPRYHDAWVHLVARYCGRVIPDYENVLMMRRITGRNEVGVLSADFLSIDEAIRSLRRVLSPSPLTQSQVAKMLLEGYSAWMHPRDREMVAFFAGYRSSPFGRLRLAFSLDYSLPTLQMNIRRSLKALLGRY